jgi:hypothetical protein
VPSTTGRVRCTSQIVACRSSDPPASTSAVSRVSSRGCRRSRSIVQASVVAVPAQPLDRPGQRGGGGLVAGGQKRQQFVGDVAIRDRLAVLVSRLQQQRQHIGTRVERRVGPRLVNEPVDDRVIAAPVVQEPAPRAPAAEVAPHERRHHGQPRTQRHRRRQQFTQLV